MPVIDSQGLLQIWVVVAIDEVSEKGGQTASEAVDSLMVVPNYCDLPLVKLQKVHNVCLHKLVAFIRMSGMSFLEDILSLCSFRRRSCSHEMLKAWSL